MAAANPISGNDKYLDPGDRSFQLTTVDLHLGDVFSMDQLEEVETRKQLLAASSHNFTPCAQEPSARFLLNYPELVGAIGDLFELASTQFMTTTSGLIQHW